uniref:Uncharacterized protein n=1 Tax=Avena sativa TaxID=4498 RepID=A0ACD5TYD3_AVESA
MEPATAHIILVACWFFFLPLSFFPHHVSAATRPISFSYNFSNTSSYRLQDLRFEGDAARNGDHVDLTRNPVQCYRSGRMSYNHPVPLYDNITGEVASFVTTFTFAINLLPNTTKKGDGMTFFLSGYPSRLPLGSYGGELGLKRSTTIPSGGDRFLAVEFDTYSSSSTSTGTQFTTDHIAIDVNSISSVSKTRLPAYSLSGNMTATITFDNATRILVATLHFDANNSLANAQVKAQLPDDLDALLPPEVAVGFSAATGEYSELHQIHSWSFNSTMAAREIPTGATKVHPQQGQVLGTQETPTGANRVQPEQGHVLRIKDSQGRALIIGGAVLLALALLLVIWSTLSWYRWKLTRDSFGKGSQVKRYEYRDLSTATDQFSETKKIGAGGFGVVYRGSHKKKEIAVKKIIKDSTGQSKDFLAELGAISQTRHSNVVRLEGWCCSINNFMFWCFHRQNIKLFLVYELVPNGNLHQHLHERPDQVLSWEKRYNIVKGLWSALHYLHHQCSPYIVHRDIKPSNILLDNEFNAKLGDFGLSRVAQHSAETSLQTTRAVGTTLYMDPLCIKDGHVNFRRSSDVYSFGIVLLEIAHGEYNPDKVRRLHTNRPGTFVEDVADRKLAGQFDKMEMEQVIILGLRCSEQEENQRPSLNSVKNFLENGAELCPATPTH